MILFYGDVSCVEVGHLVLLLSLLHVNGAVFHTSAVTFHAQQVHMNLLVVEIWIAPKVL